MLRSRCSDERHIRRRPRPRAEIETQLVPGIHADLLREQVRSRLMPQQASILSIFDRMYKSGDSRGYFARAFYRGALSP